MENKVYIILVNYKKWQDTLECLESLLNLEFSDFKIIIVDNFSNNESVEKISEWLHNYHKKRNLTIPAIIHHQATYPTSPLPENQFITLINSPVNFGFAGGNNLALKYIMPLQFDFIWFLNNDTIVDKFSLCELVKRSCNLPQEGITGSVLINYSRRNYIQGVGGKFNNYFATGSNYLENISFTEIPNEDVKIDYVIGASMLVKRKFLDEVGFMNEDYFLYYEEIDWVKRGLKKGFTIGYSKNSLVYHKEGSSIGIDHKNQIKSKLADYYSIVNRITFTRKNQPLYLFTVYIGVVLTILNRMRKGQINRALMIFKSVFLNKKLDEL